MKNLEEIQNVTAIELKRVKTKKLKEKEMSKERREIKVQIEKGNKSPNRKGN